MAIVGAYVGVVAVLPTPRTVGLCNDAFFQSLTHGRSSIGLIG